MRALILRALESAQLEDKPAGAFVVVNIATGGKEKEYRRLGRCSPSEQEWIR